ncbi:putative plant self-incompatibility S1 [Lupinus albus]|uniref:S-protein homolog n=1 Tax=Lupinus albus TaxID=3870 RepID=A0A6A4Q851_LUPAL|nr:putative plant self-incompatibility S1 [Lupinus albus]
MESSRRHDLAMKTLLLALLLLIMLLLLLIGLLSTQVVCAANTKHVSIKNKLGSSKNMTLHCQSKDDDLGEHNIADGEEFRWSFSDNVFGNTLFYCNIGWEKVQKYDFDAYSFARDKERCKSGCSWIVSVEGIYGLNSQTWFWEFIYHWPN